MNMPNYYYAADDLEDDDTEEWDTCEVLPPLSRASSRTSSRGTSPVRAVLVPPRATSPARVLRSSSPLSASSFEGFGGMYSLSLLVSWILNWHIDFLKVFTKYRTLTNDISYSIAITLLLLFQRRIQMTQQACLQHHQVTFQLQQHQVTFQLHQLLVCLIESNTDRIIFLNCYYKITDPMIYLYCSLLN